MIVNLLVTQLLVTNLLVEGKTNLFIGNGQQRQIRVSKRKKKPVPRAAPTVVVACGRLIKLALILIVLYLCWLIYVAVYEGYFVN